MAIADVQITRITRTEEHAATGSQSSALVPVPGHRAASGAFVRCSSSRGLTAHGRLAAPDGQVPRGAAGILGWEDALGSVAVGKRADLLVLYGRSGDPYARLLEARASVISLVVIDGVPRVGGERMMGALGFAGPATERWRVGSAERTLNLAQETANPVVGALKLADARDRLRDGLRRLPELARGLEEVAPRALAEAAVGAEPGWTLLLDHEEPPGFAIRRHPPLGPEGGPATPRLAEVQAQAAQPLSGLLGPLGLDPLTVADDEAFFERLGSERNLPDYVKAGLPALF